MCGSEVDYRYANTIDKTHHLRIFGLNYISIIDVLTLLRINTERCQSLLSTAIPSIVDNETIIDSPLRGNFGPTSTTCSASPSLSSTHCEREHLCSAEGKKAVCQPSEAAAWLDKDTLFSVRWLPADVGVLKTIEAALV